MKLCKDCKTKPVKSGSCKLDRFQSFARCEECHKLFKRAGARKFRARKRKEEMDFNISLIASGQQICSRCHRKKVLSEFAYSMPGRTGKLNKICDTCLTKIYASSKCYGKEFTPQFWRIKAYSCNSTARNRLERRRGYKVSLSDLEYIVKPQDLVQMFNGQEGECYYCRVDLTTETLSIDHKVPLSPDGHHSLSNLVLCCKDCNQLKLTKSDDEFFSFLRIYALRILSSNRT